MKSQAFQPFLSELLHTIVSCHHPGYCHHHLAFGRQPQPAHWVHCFPLAPPLRSPSSRNPIKTQASVVCSCARNPPMAPVLCQLKHTVNTQTFMAPRSGATTSPTSSLSLSQAPTVFQLHWPPYIPRINQVQWQTIERKTITIPSALNALPQSIA